MNIRFITLLICCLSIFRSNAQKTENPAAHRGIWPVSQANEWYKKQPWLVGANFLPSTSVNQLEMWQADSFDTVTIDKELALAQSLGMNTMRVFLHDLAYEADPSGFVDRMDKFLDIAKRHNIRPLFVIFDSCWDPFPKAGKQRDPKAFTHNSGWVQSPGQLALKDSTQYPRLERYVKAVVKHFNSDKRILGWDVWNEPDNMTGPSYEKLELPDKVKYVYTLLKQTFIWVRSANPSQPVMSGIWDGDWSSDSVLKPIEKLQIQESDIITFHNYGGAQDFEKRIKYLRRYDKPLICTEYMARPNGSVFQVILPIALKYRVGMMNWGFVNGKSQTIYPWDSWTKAYTAPPPLWFHDIFNTDGSPYKPEETKFIKAIIAQINGR